MAQVWSFSRWYKHRDSHSEYREIEVLIIAIPALIGSFTKGLHQDLCSMGREFCGIWFNVLFHVLTP